MRDLARWKGRQHAALLEKFESLTQPADADGGGAGVIVGIDDDESLAQLWKRLQDLIAHEFDVGPALGQQRREGCGVEQSEGMVGDGDDGSLCGNLR